VVTLTEPHTSLDADARVIERSWHDGDRFAEIFDRHYADIHAYAARRLGASLVDDVAAEAFLIAFDRRRRYDVRTPARGRWRRAA
jgi:RNA polymerase sigma-70 factor (ECF subfamily)